MMPHLAPQQTTRIRLLRSSSTHLASFFSVLILIAITLVAYELYLYRIDEPPERWLMHLSLGLLLVIALGLFIVGFYVTKRINEIAETAEHIMRTGDISQRIPVYQRWDDLSTLSHTLNRMLAEIETLVQGIRTVTDNIAHDLRHPLTRMRNRIEEARSAITTSSPETQAAELSQLVYECDALLNTFNGLLRISSIESGKRHSGFEPIELHRILNDIIELYEPLALDKSITIVTQCDKASLVGDKDLLFQAFANLLDNAIKFTRNEGTIRISLTRGKRAIRIDIEDEGCGIPPEHRAKVFNRFYRVETCRSTPGSGLGLSLVRAIIELHKGAISLADGEKGGLLVRITL